MIAGAIGDRSLEEQFIALRKLVIPATYSGAECAKPAPHPPAAVKQNMTSLFKAPQPWPNPIASAPKRRIGRKRHCTLFQFVQASFRLCRAPCFQSVGTDPK
jgi:hypothetical protein